MRAILIFVAVASTQFTGCASIVAGKNQPISVETQHKGQAVRGAYCELLNDKGKWFLIGLAVDAGQGAGYDYPSSITVEMGASMVIPEPTQAEAGASVRN